MSDFNVTNKWHCPSYQSSENSHVDQRLTSNNNTWPQPQFNTPNGLRPQQLCTTPSNASQPLHHSHPQSNVGQMLYPPYSEEHSNQTEHLYGRSQLQGGLQFVRQLPSSTGPPLQHSSPATQNSAPSLHHVVPQSRGPPPQHQAPPAQHPASLPHHSGPPPEYSSALRQHPGPPQQHPAPPQRCPGPPQQHPDPPQHPGRPQRHPGPPQPYPGPPQQYPGPPQQYQVPPPQQYQVPPPQKYPVPPQHHLGPPPQHLSSHEQIAGTSQCHPSSSQLHSGAPSHRTGPSQQHKPPSFQCSDPPPQLGWQPQHRGSFPSKHFQSPVPLQDFYPHSAHGQGVTAPVKSSSQFMEVPHTFPSVSHQHQPPLLGNNHLTSMTHSAFPLSQNSASTSSSSNQFASSLPMPAPNLCQFPTNNLNTSSNVNVDNKRISPILTCIKAEKDSVCFSDTSLLTNSMGDQISNSNSERYYAGIVATDVKLEIESDYGSMLPNPVSSNQQYPEYKAVPDDNSGNRDSSGFLYHHIKSENIDCNSRSPTSHENNFAINGFGNNGRENVPTCNNTNIKLENDNMSGGLGMPAPIENAYQNSHSLNIPTVNTYIENKAYAESSSGVFSNNSVAPLANIQQISANTRSYACSTNVGDSSWQYSQRYTSTSYSQSFASAYDNQNEVKYSSSKCFQQLGNNWQSYDNNGLTHQRRERQSSSPTPRASSRISRYSEDRRLERSRRGSPGPSAGMKRRRSRSRNRSTSKRRSRSRSLSRKPERLRNPGRGSKFSPERRSRNDSVSNSKRHASRSMSRRRSISRAHRSTSRTRSRTKRSASRTHSVYRSTSRTNRSTSRTRSSKHDDRHSSDSDHEITLPHALSNSSQNNTERDTVLQKYRKNYCANSNDVMQSKLQELAKMTPDEVIEQEKKVWTRTAPADLFYARDTTNPKIIAAKPKLLELCKQFNDELLDRAEKVRLSRPKYEPPPRKNRAKMAKHKSEVCSSSDSSNDESSTDEEDCTMEEMERKRLHPHRLHQELWFNDPGEMNDGPLCRCSARARRCGIRHGIYAGEKHLLKCNINSNNADKLYHYRITISPPTNFLTKTPTIINHDEHEFIFEGFSMFSHYPLEKLPTCKVIRFNIEYTILYIEETIPENFTIHELDLFHQYLFQEILELVDLDFRAYGDCTGCSQFHFMPRFVRDLSDNGKEILSMNEVLQYLLSNNRELIKESQLQDLLVMPQYKWQNFADEIKGMVVTYPGMKPCALRVDQLDRNQQGKKRPDVTDWPEIVHFGIRPPQLSYAGNPDYQKAWREYVKYRHLIANMPKPSFEDKRKLEAKENKLQEMRTLSKMKRDVTVAVKSKGFFCTGIMCDIVQHAMLIPVLVCHLRFHRSCNVLEADIGYKFDNRYLLQLALTHPSYRENFGTNPDHARNSLTNCGIRQPEYGDRRIHYMNTRKRGINTLINIMSRFGKKTETESNITHNERLEFLGDAVVEFLTSIHLFHMFPDLEEGGLATYRAAIVQNQHLAVLAKRLKLEEYMLYAHGSDLCHDLELRHAMANCFEALMGALFLDGGIEVADKVFGETLFKDKEDLLDVWVNYPPHPLQEQEPLGDRKWIPHFELLQKLTEFEKSTNIEFTHIRLLARAFTDRSIGYTNLTLGSNQRLEFLGDTVLQLIASEYLYKFFPEHHEGHLSLLRSSLVNNRTQAVVCDDLAMTNYALYANPKGELKTKDRADLLEAFLGALYVDKDLEYCHVFCHVCFFPRLQDFIMNQDWNDPKSKLQQCCLTLRTMDGGEPDIPIYKVIECKGPTNTRVYTVAVYFQNRRLASASGHSIQQAEMNAAKKALDLSQELFPQLDHQKRVIAKSMRKQKWPNRSILRGKPTKAGNESEQNETSE